MRRMIVGATAAGLTVLIGVTGVQASGLRIAYDCQTRGAVIYGAQRIPGPGEAEPLVQWSIIGTDGRIKGTQLSFGRAHGFDPRFEMPVADGEKITASLSNGDYAELTVNCATPAAAIPPAVSLPRAGSGPGSPLTLPIYLAVMGGLLGLIALGVFGIWRRPR